MRKISSLFSALVIALSLAAQYHAGPRLNDPGDGNQLSTESHIDISHPVEIILSPSKRSLSAAGSSRPDLAMKNHHFFFSAGWSIHHFKVKGGRHLDVVNAGYSAKNSPFITAGVQFYQQKTNGRVYIAPQLSAFHYSASGSFYKDFSGTTTTEFSAAAILNPQFAVGYRFLPGKTIQWYLQAAGGILLFLGHKETEIFTSNTNPPWTRTQVFNEMKPDPMNVMAKTGVIVSHRFGTWFSIMAPVNTGSHSTQSYGGLLNSSQVGFSYYFHPGK